MIPSKANALHVNFPELFVSEAVLQHLATLQRTIDEHRSGDVVLNFEKCQWFDLLPLVQLLAVLCRRSRDFAGQLHIVGPSPHVLPYISTYIKRLEVQQASPGMSPEQRDSLGRKIERHSHALPRRRRLAGAFLLGWGVFDIIEDHFATVRWYPSRSKAVSRADFNRNYPFVYGAEATTGINVSDRVWPITVVHRTEQHDVLRRLNGEDLVAGPLRQHANTALIATGVATNVVLFEPFDNIFQHAFAASADDDSGLFALRILDRIRPPAPGATPYAEWESRLLRTLSGRTVLEIVVGDAGIGIPATIGPSMIADGAYSRNLERGGSGEWHALRYAFERHSSRRTVDVPGYRGLAWLKETVAAAGGAIEVYSNGVRFVASYVNGALEELPETATNQTAAQDGGAETRVNGTFVRVLLPLSTDVRPTVDRSPLFHILEPTLFPDVQPGMAVVELPHGLQGVPDRGEWEVFINRLPEEMLRESADLVAIDLQDAPITRASLELFGEAFLNQPAVHGRLLLLNCSRHVASRLGTVNSLHRLSEAQLVVPLFRTGLRLSWIGASANVDAALVRLFRRESTVTDPQLLRIAEANAPYFTVRSGGVSLRFDSTTVEAAVRAGLGSLLERSLRQRKAYHTGRYIMPLSGRTTSGFVEPHQIFSDRDTADRLCSHLALLLRHKFARGDRASRETFKVLTATRIGRDISARMPAAYPESRFVFFDYHLVQPQKPRLLKHIANSPVVVVVDVVTTGTQVEQLIRLCESAGASVRGVVSFIDFSPGELSATRAFFTSGGEPIEHLTFWRLPQTVTDQRPGDIPVDTETFSLAPTSIDIDDTSPSDTRSLVGDRAIRFLEDTRSLHVGHFELLGRHFDFVINLGHILRTPGPEREELLRACETAILHPSSAFPTALVLYPDLSTAHMLHMALERRHRMVMRSIAKPVRFVEARRGIRARGLRYWLTKHEIADHVAWAREQYPDGYGIVILDDGASSGNTILALQQLSEVFSPRSISTFVVTNRMPALHTHHHVSLAQFVWGPTEFSYFLHLDIPTYSRRDCPLCREREELLRERRFAKGRWYLDTLSRRLEDLEPTTALHPQDVPEGRWARGSGDIPPFHWERGSAVPGPNQTLGSRAAGIRVAIESGVTLLRILNELFDSTSDDLWRFGAIEVGRRHDLQQAQRVEGIIRDELIGIVGGRNASRRASALDTLRQMRPEALVGKTEEIMQAALKHTESDEVLASLTLLFRRLLSYPHLTRDDALAGEQLIARIIDENYARAANGSPRRAALEKLSLELTTTVAHHGFDLPSLIRELEGHFQTTRHQSHRLLYQLSEYIADHGAQPEMGILGALDTVVRVSRLGVMFVQAMADRHKLQASSLVVEATEAYNRARRLSRHVRSYIHGTELFNGVRMRDELEALSEACQALCIELESQICDVPRLFVDTWHHFLKHRPNELEGIELNVAVPDPPNRSLHAICDESLFCNIIRNTMWNLRHAVDRETREIAATFAISDDNGSIITVQLTCTTGPERGAAADADSTLVRLRREAEAYGVEMDDRRTLPVPADIKWAEAWYFRRL